HRDSDTPGLPRSLSSFYRSRPHRAPPSFPTRCSSDLAVTVTLRAKDANGNSLTTGGATVVFTASGGTSTGTIGATTDNGNGTYKDRNSTRLNSSHRTISYGAFCLKKKKHAQNKMSPTT